MLKDDEDVQRMEEELEEDPEVRTNVNMYHNPEANFSDNEDLPRVDLAELLDAVNLDDKTVPADF